MRKVTERPCFQGDLMIRRIDQLPNDLKVVPAVNGVHILAHSETGHHHVIKEQAADRFIDETNQFISYLSVLSDAEIEHLRSFDTHEALGVEAGTIYEVRTQREYIPEGWRRAQD
jgi:hypothetical protein